MGPTSSSVEFSPQGLLEKVFTPLVVHSQICPACTCGSTAVCAGGVEGLGAESVNVAGNAAGGPGCGADCDVAVAGNSCGTRARAAAAGGAKVASALWVETAAKATAMAAADRPPKIQGSKSRSLYIPPIILRGAQSGNEDAHSFAKVRPESDSAMSF